MCKCTPEIRTPFCGRGECLPPASREPTESLFVEYVIAQFECRDQAERLQAKLTRAEAEVTRLREALDSHQESQ